MEAGTVRGEGNSTAAAQADANNKAQQQANGMTCKTQYSSVAKSGSATRNNCGSGCTGSSVTYTVAAGKYKSCVSQSDADSQAQRDVDSNKQSYANSHGSCTCPSCDLHVDFTIYRDTSTVGRIDAYLSKFDRKNCSGGSARIELNLYGAVFNDTRTPIMTFTTDATGILCSGKQINFNSGYTCNDVSASAYFAGYLNSSTCPDCEITYSNTKHC